MSNGTGLLLLLVGAGVGYVAARELERKDDGESEQLKTATEVSSRRSRDQRAAEAAASGALA